MEIPTHPGKTYILTCKNACLVHAVVEQKQYILLKAAAGGQYAFVAPASSVTVSDDDAKVTMSFDDASSGSSAGRGELLIQRINPVNQDAAYVRII